MAIDASAMDMLTNQFLQAFQMHAYKIQLVAKRLFVSLTIIQLTLSCLWMVIEGESLQQFFVKLIKMSMSFGFFYSLLLSSHEWLPQILNGFIAIGDTGTVHSLSVSSIVAQGMYISGLIAKGFKGLGLVTHPFLSILSAAICLAVLVLYALIAAQLALVLVKSYLLIALGSLFFAFSGCDYTQTMTHHFIRKIIFVGLELMTLYLLINAGQSIGESWGDGVIQAVHAHDASPLLLILAFATCYYLIIKNIPAFIASLADFSQQTTQGELAASIVASQSVAKNNPSNTFKEKKEQLQLVRALANLTKSKQ